jgi:hypothetical protein
VRKLYLVPIIHMSADMGSVAPVLNEGAAAGLGRKLWQEHKGVVSAFWDSIARFVDALDVVGFKVYQDGLLADGAGGLKIVREGINVGSKNYEIIDKLLKRGAVLVKTEDLSLVKQEYEYITSIARAQSLKEKETASQLYRRVQNKLLQQRDEFIARRIQETLGDGETGILFLGAYHDILSRLAPDIQVVQVKDAAKVREYHQRLASRRRDSRLFRQLSEYLAEG